MPKEIRLTVACDTRLARLLLETLAPLLKDGVLAETDLRRIVAGAITTTMLTRPTI
jgi:hypothetical protein